MKTPENDVKYSSFNMGEMDKSREWYSREGDNSSRFEGKTVPWEHTICNRDMIWLILYIPQVWIDNSGWGSTFNSCSSFPQIDSNFLDIYTWIENIPYFCAVYPYPTYIQEILLYWAWPS